ADRTVSHRTAIIDQQMTAQVGLVLEFLDEVTVRAGKEPPVEIARIVAGRVLAVLGELDGEPVIGAAMAPVPESFHHDTGAQFQIPDRHQRLRVDQGTRTLLERRDTRPGRSRGHSAKPPAELEDSPVSTIPGMIRNASG